RASPWRLCRGADGVLRAVHLYDTHLCGDAHSSVSHGLVLQAPRLVLADGSSLNLRNLATLKPCMGFIASPPTESRTGTALAHRASSAGPQSMVVSPE